MKNRKHLVTGMILLVIACCFIIRSNSFSSAIHQSLLICSTSILPSLFPFFVLSDYWIRCGNAASISQLAAPLMERIFHLPGSTASAFLLGCVGGYPIGARTIAQLYQEKQLDQSDAENALMFCNNAGPAFIIGVIGNSVLHSLSAGVVLYGIHVLAATMVGILFRPKQSPQPQIYRNQNNAKSSFSSSITASISSGGATAIQVCTFILFFSVIIQLISDLFPVSFHTDWFPVLLGMIELSSGSKLLASSNLSMQIQFASSAFLLGFGGLCVYLQSLALLHPAGLSGKKIFTSKLLQGSISALLAYIIWPMLPAPILCISTQNPSGTAIVYQLIILTISLVWLSVFLKKSSGKHTNNRL